MTKEFCRLFRYEFLNVMRARWILLYGAGFFVFTVALLRFGSQGDRATASLLGFVLLLAPMVSLFYSTVYWYNSSSFTSVLLSQPLRRTSVYLAAWAAVASALSGGFVFGTAAALAVNASFGLGMIFLLVFGTVLTSIFCAIGMLIAVLVDDRMKGIGMAFLAWLYFAVLHDALVFSLLSAFNEYPVEVPALTLSAANPIDLARLSLLLLLDRSAMMGYTGRILQSLLSSPTGLALSCASLGLWLVLPLVWGVVVFRRKDL